MSVSRFCESSTFLGNVYQYPYLLQYSTYAYLYIALKHAQLTFTEITGGLSEVLCSAPGFFVIMIYDKGFVQYIHAGQNHAYLKVAEVIGRQVGARVVYYVPNDDWFYARGNRRAPPTTPPNTDRGKLLREVQANHIRAQCTCNCS